MGSLVSGSISWEASYNPSIKGQHHPRATFFRLEKHLGYVLVLVALAFISFLPSKCHSYYKSIKLASLEIDTVVLNGGAESLGQVSPVLRSFERRADAQTKPTRLCQGRYFQSALVKDTIFIDGGQWFGEFPGDDGTPVVPRDYLYYINLTQPFAIGQETTIPGLVIHNMSKPASDTPVVLGSLLANDGGFVQYCGMTESADWESTTRGENAVVRFEYEDTSPGTTQWTTGYANAMASLGNSVSNYVGGGAYANIPSENLGCYFSGLKKIDGSELKYPADSPSNLTLSKSLIIADLSNEQWPSFANETIDIKVKPRAFAQLVWVPVGERGALVAVGGVPQTDPSCVDVYAINNGTQIPAATLDMRKGNAKQLLTSVSIYDIAQNKWYEQQATGDLGSLPAGGISAGCVIVASADDLSSHDIYIYGGTDATTPNGEIYGQVWVLSLPSFRWISYFNSTDRAKYGHQCYRVAPNLIMSIAGISETNSVQSCSEDFGLVDLFDVNKPAFLTNYDPSQTESYNSSKIQELIQRGSNGIAKITEPEKGWSDNGLSMLFQTKYTKAINTHWPYPRVEYSPSGTSSKASPVASNGTTPQSPTFPHYLPPLVGVIFGLLVLVIIWRVALCVLNNKRCRGAPPNDTEGATVRKYKQTWNWLMGVYGDGKTYTRRSLPRYRRRRQYSDSRTRTISTGRTYVQKPGMELDSVMNSVSPPRENTEATEIQGGSVYEMPDTSKPHELDSYSRALNLQTDPAGKKAMYKEDEKGGYGDKAETLRPEEQQKTEETSETDYASNAGTDRTLPRYEE